MLGLQSCTTAVIHIVQNQTVALYYRAGDIVHFVFVPEDGLLGRNTYLCSRVRCGMGWLSLYLSDHDDGGAVVGL